MSHLLDTDSCSALIRRRSPLVVARLRERAVGTVALSAITIAELAYGAAKSSRPAENRRALNQFLHPFVIARSIWRPRSPTGNCGQPSNGRGHQSAHSTA